VAADERLTPADPDSEACYEALVARVRHELQARTAIGDDPTTPAGQQVLAELIADVVLDGFILRPRTEARYRRG
jgi:hypothetical protein